MNQNNDHEQKCAILDAFLQGDGVHALGRRFEFTVFQVEQVIREALRRALD